MPQISNEDVLALKAITARLEPDPAIDCVWGPWVVQSATEWVTDLSAGTRSRTVTETRSIATPAANGGLPCEGPTTQQRVETEPVAIDCALGEPVKVGETVTEICQPDGFQTVIEHYSREVLVTPKNGGTPCGPTSFDVAVERACVYVPPQTGNNWPPTMPAQPTAAEMAAWKQGQGYPEPRVYVQAQWHEDQQRRVDNMTHFHLEMAIPRRVTSQIVRYDCLVTFFHAEGYTFTGIRKTPVRTNQPYDTWKPNPLRPTDDDWEGIYNIPITQHIQQVWVPVYINFMNTTPGTYTVEFDAAAVRPDGQNVQTRLITSQTVALGGSTLAGATSGSVSSEGWVSNNLSGAQFGYLSVQSWGMKHVVSDVANQITMVARSIAGRTVRLQILKNADLHQHPANYGTVLFDQTFVMDAAGKKAFQIPHPVVVAGDKFAIRLLDAEAPVVAGEPDIGAAAQLLVWTVTG